MQLEQHKKVEYITPLPTPVFLLIFIKNTSLTKITNVVVEISIFSYI